MKWEDEPTEAQLTFVRKARRVIFVILLVALFAFVALSPVWKLW